MGGSRRHVVGVCRASNKEGHRQTANISISSTSCMVMMRKGAASASVNPCTRATSHDVGYRHAPMSNWCRKSDCTLVVVVLMCGHMGDVVRECTCEQVRTTSGLHGCILRALGTQGGNTERETRLHLSLFCVSLLVGGLETALPLPLVVGVAFPKSSSKPLAFLFMTAAPLFGV